MRVGENDFIIIYYISLDYLGWNWGEKINILLFNLVEKS